MHGRMDAKKAWNFFINEWSITSQEEVCCTELASQLANQFLHNS